MNRIGEGGPSLPVRTRDALHVLTSRLDRTRHLHRLQHRDAASGTPTAEHIVTEIRGQSRASDGGLVQFHYVKTEARWPHPHASPQSTAKPRGVAMRHPLLLLTAPAALAVLTGIVAGGRASDPQPAVPPQAAKLRIMLDDTPAPADFRSVKLPRAPETRAAAFRPAPAAMLPDMQRKDARPTVIATLAPPAPLRAPLDKQSAIGRAIESGSVQPWSEDEREGFVLAGPVRDGNGDGCREITVLTRGDAQGAATSNVQCRTPH